MLLINYSFSFSFCEPLYRFHSAHTWIALAFIVFYMALCMRDDDDSVSNELRPVNDGVQCCADIFTMCIVF